MTTIIIEESSQTIAVIENGTYGDIFLAGVGDVYDSFTDGTNTANATGNDTFKFRSANGLLSLVVTDNDPTHGDNLLLTVNQSAFTFDQSQVTNLVTDLAGKEPAIASGTSGQYWRGDKTFQTLDKAAVGLANVDNTSDLGKPISTATQSALNGKEPIISAGTTGQYWRGDKTFQTLDKAAVGLANVDNTSDANKPISTATQSALDGKQDEVSFSTSGNSGAATFVGAALNIPNYTLAGLGGQPLLVSGVNIKTINGNSLLGSGDITISGGGGGLSNAYSSFTDGTTTASASGGDTFKYRSANNLLSVAVGSNDPTHGDNLLLTVNQGNLALAQSQIASLVSDLAGKEPTISAGTTGQYWRGDKTFHVLNKAAVGLANVDNTSDANKPISTATQSALDGKEATILAGTTGQYWRGDKTFQALDKAAVGLANVDNTSDANKPISTATQSALNNKQDLDADLTALAGLTPANDDIIQRKAGAWANRTPAQFKSDLSLTKADVGLSNVENTALSTWAGSTNLVTLGTVATGTWQATPIADSFVASAGTWNAKQNAISLTTSGNSGAATFVGATLNVPNYTLAGLGGISLTGLSATSPVQYDNGTGVFSILTASGAQSGALSSTDWTTFNSKVNPGLIGSSGLTMATNRLLGRTTATTGAVEEISVGSFLSLSSGSLSVTLAGRSRFELGAGFFAPAVTSGAQATVIEYATNKATRDCYLFDSVSLETIYCDLPLPGTWDLGTLKFRFIWGAPSGASVGQTVRFGVSCIALSDDDAIDIAFPANVTIDDAVLAIGDNHLTAATASVTIGNTPILDDTILCRIQRPIFGTLSVDLQFFGVIVEYGITSGYPTPY